MILGQPIHVVVVGPVDVQVAEEGKGPFLVLARRRERPTAAGAESDRPGDGSYKVSSCHLRLHRWLPVVDESGRSSVAGLCEAGLTEASYRRQPANTPSRP